MQKAVHGITVAHFFETHREKLRMEIVAGQCLVTLDGQSDAEDYSANQSFDVPANSGFTIEVKKGLCEYICSFL